MTSKDRNKTIKNMRLKGYDEMLNQELFKFKSLWDLENISLQRNHFLRGMGSVLQIFPTEELNLVEKILISKNINLLLKKREYIPNRDLDALKSDWNLIGKDLIFAINNFYKHHID